ncbi:GGDEF domain-containing protein [Nocardioides humilatus]|nr:GGDEF domain-containing protein [Nocardioides humilatus]
MDGVDVRGWPFLRAPLRLRVWVTTAVVGALAVPLLTNELGHGSTSGAPVLTGLLLVLLSIVNVELGRLLEGGASDSQRPHKGLSAWAFASALLLPTPWLLPVVAITYAHAWWRGLRVATWKWIGSAAYVVLAGVAASLVAHRVMADEPDLMHGSGFLGLATVVTAAAAFLGVETLLFHGSAYLNEAGDEGWLRQTLATWSFYLTEAGVLLVGGLSAAIWTGGGWFVVLLAPVYLITQRAALHEPLRERAEYDEKTRALRFESWRRLSVQGAARCARRGQPWCLIFADLDHFKDFNEAWGHLVGDEALALVADAIRAEVRDNDLLGRFGGEEFSVMLPDVTAAEATAIAERIRCRVATTSFPGAGAITISLGVAAVGADEGAVEFVEVLSAADRALFTAKNDGRDRIRTVALDAA